MENSNLDLLEEIIEPDRGGASSHGLEEKSSFNIIFLPFVGNISPTECFEWIIILHLQYYRVS
jgi:hypothetical protein